MDYQFTKTKELYQTFLKSNGVSIDSRTIQKGQIFFAIKGPNFDGHKYIEAAFASGAHCVVIDNPSFHHGQQTLLVEDAEMALQNLAKFHRLKLSIPIIGLTGSNGKTTTKELLASILKEKYDVFATKGNLNNHLGVPLSILSINAQHELAVIEMGANHVGEIKFLCEISMPDIGFITNIGKAHLEGFGGIEGVRKGKTELYDYLRKTKGQILYHQGDPLLVASISEEDDATSYDTSDISVKKTFPALEIDYKGNTIFSHLTGGYNVTNIAAAIAVASLFKISLEDICSGITSYMPTNNRSQIHKTEHNTLILDAYNANPSSMRVSIGNLADSDAKKKVLILGHMLELGSTAQQEHQDLCNYILSKNWEAIYLVGNLFCNVDDHPRLSKYVDAAALSLHLHQNPIEDCTILLKGSRGVALERLIAAL